MLSIFMPQCRYRISRPLTSFIADIVCRQSGTMRICALALNVHEAITTTDGAKVQSAFAGNICILHFDLVNDIRHHSQKYEPPT